MADVSRIYGKIQLVDAFPDYKVKVVDAFPDLKVQKVTAFADSVGKWEIVDAFAHGNYDAAVGDIAIKKVLTIKKDAQLIDAVELMEKHKVGRLIIMDNEEPISIITRTDVISRMIE